MYLTIFSRKMNNIQQYVTGVNPARVPFIRSHGPPSLFSYAQETVELDRNPDVLLYLFIGILYFSAVLRCSITAMNNRIKQQSSEYGGVNGK